MYHDLERATRATTCSLANGAFGAVVAMAIAVVVIARFDDIFAVWLGAFQGHAIAVGLGKVNHGGYSFLRGDIGHFWGRGQWCKLLMLACHSRMGIGQ